MGDAVKERPSNLTIRAFATPWASFVELVGFADHKDGARAVVKNLVLQKVDEGAMVDPFARLDMAAAQAAHLADMRAIAFHKLGVPQP
jgi:hypothetical protein